MRIFCTLFFFSLQVFAQGETPEDPGIRRRCEMMQAKVRRTEHLIERYREVKGKSKNLRDRASFDRQVARNNLKSVEDEIQKRIRYYTKWTREMKEKLVRRGCPKESFANIDGEKIKKLIDKANSQGVFVDDHVLRFPQESQFTESF